MSYEAVFNRYDVRGEYPGEIDDEFAERFGRAVGTYAMRRSRGRVVVGRDTRESSERVMELFLEGVRSTGCSAVSVGVGPTDMVALASSHYGGLGVMVTASHHAWERTGFKLLYEEGYGFSNEDLADVKQLFRGREFESGSEGPLLEMKYEFREEYIERAAEFLRDYEDIDGKILVDGCNGAGFDVGPALLEEIGFDVVRVNCESRAGGVDPEPDEGSRREVVELLREEGADLVVGYDPDADRVYVVHPERGWLDGNEVFYLLGKVLGVGKIAASVDSSGLIEELGAEVRYSRVGDVFVSALGYEFGADLLGEPNGHYAVTGFCWYNSGILCSALLALHHDRLGGLLEEAPSYYTERRVLHVDSAEEKEEVVRKAMQYAAREYEIDSTVDGVKFGGDGFSALIRPSGTSRKVRLIVNGRNEEWVAEVADAIAGELF